MANKLDLNKLDLLIEWDTCNIATQRAMDLIDQASDEGEHLDENAAFSMACEDTFYYQCEWEYLIEYLTELIAERNPGGEWCCDMRSFGWRGVDGYKYFAASDGAELLAAVLPKCECTFKVFDYGKGFAIQNWHHDSPVGKEWYYIVPDERVSCAVCGDKDEIRTCEGCGDDLCPDCFGPGNMCYYCEG